MKAALAKPRGERKSSEAPDYAVRELVAKAILPEGEIIDVFSAAGLKQPDISIYSPVAHRLTHSGLPIYVAASQHVHCLRPIPALPRNPAADSGAGGLVEHLRTLLNVASGGVVLTPARPRLVGRRQRFAQSMSIGPRLPPFTTI